MLSRLWICPFVSNHHHVPQIACDMPWQAEYLLLLFVRLTGDSVLDSSSGKPAAGVNIHLQEFIPGTTADVFQFIAAECVATP
jgi:hypothetical protein